MKVSELIEELSKHNQDLEVVVDGYEYGHTSVTPDKISLGHVEWNYNLEGHDWGGEHGDADIGPAKSTTEVLMIGRD